MTNARRDKIRATQTELVYDGVWRSALGTLLAAGVLLVIYGPISGYPSVLGWLGVMLAVYAVRVVDLLAFRKRDPAADSAGRMRRWHRRVGAGALASSLAWSLALVLVYPEGRPAYEALLIMMIGGVAAGALVTLPCDPRLNNAFQAILLVSVQARLWFEGGQYAIELAVFALFVFGFMFTGGLQVGKNYVALLTLRHEMEETNLEVLRTTGEMALVGYWQWGGATSVTLSEALVTLSGARSPTQGLAACYRRVHPDDRPEFRRKVAEAVRLGEQVTHEYRFEPFDGGDYRHVKQVIKSLADAAGARVLLGAVQDVSDIVRTEERVVRLAYHDALTDLANRARFHEELEDAVRVAARTGESVAVIAVDLDDFSGINHSFGHERADAYLVEVAKHLHRSVRRSDLVARFDGDEFVVILRDCGPDTARDTVGRILDLTQSTVPVGTYRIRPRLSAGVALYPNDALTPDALIARVEEALGHAKRKGADTPVVFYDAELENDRVERVRLESDLRRALAEDEFELWYQPKIDVAADRMSGVEALIRWRHPERGLVPPGLFIDFVERIGMIAELGDWVLVRAARQRAAWGALGIDATVSINIAGSHFLSPGFALRVRDVLAEHGLGPGTLEIEITESMSRNPAEQTRVCRELHDVGVSVAIDDFGTGYSSLGVLADLEIDTIKIDRAFVVGLDERANAGQMIETIVKLAHGCGLEVVAEGVETEAQLAFVVGTGCNVIQGYWFSPPVEAARIPALARAGWKAGALAA